MTAALTPAQREALAILARAVNNNRSVGIAHTRTTSVGGPYPFVDLVAAYDLMGLGLAERMGACMVLTPAGAQRASDEGMS